jgi:hypothetical protein
VAVVTVAGNCHGVQANCGHRKWPQLVVVNGIGEKRVPTLTSVTFWKDSVSCLIFSLLSHPHGTNTPMLSSGLACKCACVCARARVCACVCVCARARVCVCACV